MNKGVLMCFYTCIISQSEVILQPLTGFKVHFILLFCVFVLFCVGVGACMWACLGMKVDFHYKSWNVREGLWTCCSVHAWVCGPVPMLVTKGRSLFLFFFFCLTALGVFLYETRLCLGTLLPPYCSGESVPAAGAIGSPPCLHLCVSRGMSKLWPIYKTAL